MSDIKQQWQELEGKFFALTQREKQFIMIGAAVGVAAALYFGLVEPSIKQLQQLKAQYSNEVSQLDTTKVQIADIEQALLADPNETIKNEIKALKASISEADAALEQVMTEYIAPEQMAAALTDLMTTTPGIRIVGMSVNAPELVQSSSNQDLASYFKHKFNIELEGDYFALQKFVKKVSASDSKFTINHLAYKVIKHPKALMTLTLVTISDNEKVIRL